MKLITIITILLSVLILTGCDNNKSEKVQLPSKVYNYVKIDTSALASKHSVYVPVYSNIYAESGTSSVYLTATLSIRNTSYTDSFT